MRQKMKQLMGILFSISLMLGLVPGMSLTAYAAGEKAYAAYDVTTETNKTKSVDDLKALQVTFNGKKWYIIEDNSSSATSGTVTLLSADTTFGTKEFANNQSNKYSTSQVKAYLDRMTGTNGDFADVADAIETVDLTTNRYRNTGVYETVNGVKLYLLSTEEARSLPANVRKAEFRAAYNSNVWWLRSPGYAGTGAAFVYGDYGYVYDRGYDVRDAFGVRPALKLNLSSVIFLSKTNTFSLKPAGYSVTLSGGANATRSGGETRQTGLTDAMAIVTYTANTGYYFKEFADISNNGITARRKSSTVVTVSGTPKADATIKVPDAVEITRTKTDDKVIDSLPQTGDTEKPLLYGLAALLACIGLGFVVKRKQ